MSWPDPDRARNALHGQRGWVLRAILASRDEDDEPDLAARVREAERLATAAILERDRLRAELDRVRLAMIRKNRGSTTKRRRRPPEAGEFIPAIPPRGPLPLQGGAQAPLEFDA